MRCPFRNVFRLLPTPPIILSPYQWLLVLAAKTSAATGKAFKNKLHQLSFQIISEFKPKI